MVRRIRAPRAARGAIMTAYPDTDTYQVIEHTSAWSRRLFLRIWWRLWVRNSLADFDNNVRV